MRHADAATYTPYAGCLPYLVLEYFRQNPDEELTQEDITQKFSVAKSRIPIAEKMFPLVKMQLLKSEPSGRRISYSAGPMLGAWPGKTKHRSAPKKVEKACTGPRPLEIRVTLHVHNAGTDRQRVEVMGVEP